MQRILDNLVGSDWENSEWTNISSKKQKRS